mmetsp:Transcript_16836/g.16089  ORF Transcript_16836/g.16089 Transcript_16836/m.16089 type:complete len:133 (+) Transcript_16836:666-1064(+)
MKSGSKKPYRGEEEELQVVSDKLFVKTYQFNQVSDFTTEEGPQNVLQAIEEFKADCNNDLEIAPNLEKKFILLQDKSRNLEIKLKLLKEVESQERLRLKFLKKKGSLQDQYEFMDSLTPYIWEICVPNEDQE